MKEDKLDKIFQEAARGVDFGNGADAWNSMKLKLEGEMLLPEQKKGSSFRWPTLLLVLLLLIATTGIIWNYLDNQRSEVASSSLIENDNGNNNQAALLSDQKRNERQVLKGENNASQSVESPVDKISNTTTTDQSIGDESAVKSHENETAGLSYENKDTNESDESQTVKVEGKASALIKSAKDGQDKTSVLKTNNQNSEHQIILDQKEEADEDKKVNDHIISRNSESKNELSEAVGNTKEQLLISENTVTKNRSSNEIVNAKNDLSLTESKTSSDKVLNERALDNVSLNANSNNVSGRSNNQSGLTDNKGRYSVEEENETISGLKNMTELASNAFNKSDDLEEALITEEAKSQSYAWQPALLDSKPFKELEAKYNLFSPTLAPDQIIQSESDIVRRPGALRSRWSVGLEFTPDLSGAGLTQVEDAGFNIGLNLEYHISDRFSINSGLVYAKKLYFADEGIESYRTNPRWELDRVNANCDVIDIPLNLNYYVAGRERSGFVFSAGFSTYLMLTEDYDIIYQDPWPENSVTIRNENNHFFGIFNASVGYRKILNPTLSLQVDPFVKIPLQGIGDGNLDLFTSGLRLTLKYSKLHINR